MRGVGDGSDDLGAVVGGDQNAAVHVDDADVAVLGIERHDGVEEVLGRQRVGHLVGAVRDTDDAPVAGLGGERERGVDGRVGAVEVAEPEVDDAGALGSGGADQVAGEAGRRGEGGAGELGHGGHQSRTEPSTRRAVGR